jgi:hypothetical protein
MIDATHCKVHPHAAGAVGRNQAMNRTKGLNIKIHLAVDSHGLAVRAIITEGAVADCTKAIDLINGFAANHLLADRAYDTREIIEYAENNGIGIVIPQKESPQTAGLQLGFIQIKAFG